MSHHLTLPKFTKHAALLMIMRLALSAVVLLLPGNTLLWSQALTHVPVNRELTKVEERWVRETLKKMTLTEKIGQMFMADGSAVFMNRASEAYRQLEHHIRDNKVGGIIYFRGDIWATAIWTNRMQRLAATPLLVSADLEMGLGMRFNDTPWWQPNMAVAATGNPNYARLQGEITANEARAIGVNWLYAPVADVNNNADNPVINVRSYGEDPNTVAQFVSAFITGAQNAGALSCAKHFPGHGDTATDSHLGLPVVNVNKTRLSQIELVPFRAAIAAGVGSIMTAHIALPQIEPEPVAPLRSLSAREREAAEFLSQQESTALKPTKPATLSEKILTGILRDELEFDGLVVTDAMNMAGIAARYDAAAAAVTAIKAGIDVIEKSPDIDAAIRGVRDAVQRGEIPAARIEAAVEKILRAKAALRLNANRFVTLDWIDKVVSTPEHLAVAAEIAERSLTLVRDKKKIFPLQLSSGARVLNITFADDDGAFTIQPFNQELRRRGIEVESLVFDQRSTEASLVRLGEKLIQEKNALLLFTSLVRARSGKGSLALPPVGLRIANLLLQQERPCAVISFGNPYLLTALPQASTYLAAYSPYPVSQMAVVRALLGEIPITGKLPVSLPNLAVRGTGIDVPKK